MAHLTDKYSPIKPFGYFFLQILYSIPVIGFIFLIIHAIGYENINRKNFARSYFCGLILVVIIFIVVMTTGLSVTIIEYLKSTLK